MNKNLLLTLTLIVMLAPACKDEQSAINNANQNGNRNSNQNANNANQNAKTVIYNGQTFTADDLPSKITLKYRITENGDNVMLGEQCISCTTIFPEMVTVNKDSTAELTWAIEFLSTSNTAVVRIKNFKDLAGNEANPFDKSSSTSPTYELKAGHLAEVVKPQKAGGFKYTVELVYSGKTTVIDPRVVFSDTGFTLRNTTASPSK